jgi:hypothetical protein
MHNFIHLPLKHKLTLMGLSLVLIGLGVALPVLLR